MVVLFVVSWLLFVLWWWFCFIVVVFLIVLFFLVVFMAFFGHSDCFIGCSSLVEFLERQAVSWFGLDVSFYKGPEKAV